MKNKLSQDIWCIECKHIVEGKCKDNHKEKHLQLSNIKTRDISKKFKKFFTENYDLIKEIGDD